MILFLSYLLISYEVDFYFQFKVIFWNRRIDTQYYLCGHVWWRSWWKIFVFVLQKVIMKFFAYEIARLYVVWKICLCSFCWFCCSFCSLWKLECTAKYRTHWCWFILWSIIQFSTRSGIFDTEEFWKKNVFKDMGKHYDWGMVVIVGIGGNYFVPRIDFVVEYY